MAAHAMGAGQPEPGCERAAFSRDVEEALPQTMAVVVQARAERLGQVRLAARGFAEAHGVERPADVALAVGEACANVVMHAYTAGEPGDLRLTGAREDGHVRFLVADDGPGLVPRPDSPGLGMGLPIIAQVADEFEVRDGDGRGTRVRIGFVVAERADHRSPQIQASDSQPNEHAPRNATDGRPRP